MRIWCATSKWFLFELAKACKVKCMSNTYQGFHLLYLDPNTDVYMYHYCKPQQVCAILSHLERPMWTWDNTCILILYTFSQRLLYIYIYLNPASKMMTMRLNIHPAFWKAKGIVSAPVPTIRLNRYTNPTCENNEDNSIIHF